MAGGGALSSGGQREADERRATGGASEARHVGEAAARGAHVKVLFGGSWKSGAGYCDWHWRRRVIDGRIINISKHVIDIQYQKH